MNQSVNSQVLGETEQSKLDGERAWVMYGDVYVRRTVVRESRYLNWLFETWRPFMCPGCHAINVRHAFEYFIRCADGSLEAWCELCVKYYPFHN